jgi:hypothetical protein
MESREEARIVTGRKGFYRLLRTGSGIRAKKWRAAYP